jgi:hypothetical protein
VCPKSEVAEHKKHDYSKGLDILGWEDGVHLADKRLGVAKWLDNEGVKQFLFLDDDLKLSVWLSDEKKFRSTRKLHDNGTGPVDYYLSQYTDRLFKEYAGVGYGCMSMQARMEAIKEGNFQQVNKKMCCIFGYRTEEFLARMDHPKFEKIWGIDTVWNLETMVKTDDIVTDHHLAWTTDFAVNNGGASIYRNKPDVLHSFLRMMLLHPGLISRGKDGVHVHSFLRISWKDIPKYGTYSLSEKGARIFFDELKHQKTSVKEFLKKCPKDSMPWYSNRIEKLKSLL